jgi:protein-L-isoaspartate(D-aspartate) O-methyltransferase
MVDCQLRRRAIRDERVLAAMLEIPREQFVPPEERVSAYADCPIPIGRGQTISQPYMTALMAESLELTGGETVLEIGAGSGYAAAVLGALAAQVVSIEIVPALADLARENLRRAGRGGNVTVVCGDGSMGYPEMAPYDAISVAAGAPEIPAALLEQLRDPGRLVIPVGDWGHQNLRVVVKHGGRVSDRVATGCLFVPLRGSDGWQ